MQVRPSTQLRFLSALQLQLSDSRVENASTEALVDAAIAQASAGSGGVDDVAALRKSAAAYLGFGNDRQRLAGKLAIDLAAAALAMTTNDLGSRLANVGQAAVDGAKGANRFDDLLAATRGRESAESHGPSWAERIREGRAERSKRAREAAEEISTLRYPPSQRRSDLDALRRAATDCDDFDRFSHDIGNYVERSAAAGLVVDEADLDSLVETAKSSYFQSLLKATSLPRLAKINSAVDMAKEMLGADNPVVVELSAKRELAELRALARTNEEKAISALKHYMRNTDASPQEKTDLVELMYLNEEYERRVNSPNDFEPFLNRRLAKLQTYADAAGLPKEAIQTKREETVIRFRRRAIRQMSYRRTEHWRSVLEKQRPLSAEEQSMHARIKPAADDRRQARKAWSTTVEESSWSPSTVRAEFFPRLADVGDKLLKAEAALRAADDEAHDDSSTLVETSLKEASAKFREPHRDIAYISLPNQADGFDIFLTSPDGEETLADFRGLDFLEARALVDGNRIDELRAEALRTLAGRLVLHRASRVSPQRLREQLSLFVNVDDIDNLADVDAAALDSLTKQVASRQHTPMRTAVRALQLYRYASELGRVDEARERIHAALVAGKEHAAIADAFAQAVCNDDESISDEDRARQLTDHFLCAAPAQASTPHEPRP